jgi:histidyl-tRNA synthetase
MGSILGGGRYDDLTGVFGMPDVSGVGISFGVERIYDILLELERFPASLAQSLDALFVAMDPASHKHAFGLVTRMRQHGFCVDLYPEASKMKKMLRYADQRNVPYVIIVGSEEVVSKQYSLKHMTSGDQWTLNLEQIMAKLKA